MLMTALLMLLWLMSDLLIGMVATYIWVLKFRKNIHLLVLLLTIFSVCSGVTMVHTLF